MTATAPSPAKSTPRWMDEELTAVADLARKFFAKEVTPHTDRFIAQGFPDRDVYRKAGELGLLGMSIPEEYGGGGGTFAHEIVLFTEQVRACESSMQLGVHTGVVLHYLLAYGGEEQKRRWLPKLTSGEWIGAIAMTEPGAGSDLQGITTRAVREGDHYLISGAKTFISNGRNCDLVIIAAKTDTSKGAAGVSLLVAEVGDDTPGFERGRILDKIGQKGQDTTELFFDNLKVPAEHLLGEAEGLGFYQLMEQLPQERLIAAGAAVASMELAVELTTDYTKSRMAFGKPLFALQNTRFELAHCASVAQIGRVFLDDCIEKHLRGELDIATAAMAKYWLTEQQCDVATRCLQLFGGYGYTMEYPIAKIFTDSRIQKIYAGANEVMKELIARSL
ncbi:acyl-CoA dehydrogenase family protein [Hoyosella subflava]|uniref:Acyl-[acyl-carrier-protein] dehydrogenase MbtN n=1 Tax=Hoyosella subflava (strain DSM 45089 / JCM 17490 / NBRC 109087 / DQS3-9A1) TaxID=443218 RepID=F6EL85_HOYSD|nr:acyl-CoA dehydrogenase family protein [Hoyosella subflava]AEF39177.1 Long-chain specific acyl-coa dehydrogenase [Hoyosella subflava DQS3-9A1]